MQEIGWIQDMGHAGGRSCIKWDQWTCRKLDGWDNQVMGYAGDHIWDES